MKRFGYKRSLLIMISAVFVGALSGCGEQAAVGQSPAKILPFKNELKLMVVTPSSVFDTHVAPPGLYNHVSAVNANGQKVTLNVKNQPLLFVAYWCPHCQRTLVAFNHNQRLFQQIPVIVSEGFLSGTTLTQAVQITHQEINAFHLRGFKVEYILSPKARVQNAQHGFPTLAFVRQGKTLTLSGEHTLSVWEKALAKG